MVAVSETRFFDPANPPVWTTPEWYEPIERAPHLEQPEHRDRLLRAAEFVRQAVEWGATTVSDLGAGDGGLLSLLDDLSVPAWGYDLTPANVDAAVNERHVAVTRANFLTDSVQLGDCVVLTEVLEHLVDPHGVLAELHDPQRTPEFIVASSPMNETWESRYEFHTWGWDHDGYAAMFEAAGWIVRQHLSWSPGFQVLLAQR